MGSTTVVEKPIIFFDGVCGMCNVFVNLILRVDTSGKFLFAPIQGETAKELLPPFGDDPKQWSMIYLDERGIHDQSDASLEVYRRLGGIWSILALARFVPAQLRTPVYRTIAANRYKWFGKQESCRIPTPAEQVRFLP